GGRATGGGGSVVPGAAPAGIARAADGGLGSIGEQPASQILPAYGGGAAGPGGGDGAMAADVGGDREDYGAGLESEQRRASTSPQRRRDAEISAEKGMEDKSRLGEWLRATGFGEAWSADWMRVRTVFLRRRLESDLEDEMQFHLAMREERERAAGASLGDARAAARRQFGNVTSVTETCREL